MHDRGLPFARGLQERAGRWFDHDAGQRDTGWLQDDDGFRLASHWCPGETQQPMRASEVDQPLAVRAIQCRIGPQQKIDAVVEHVGDDGGVAAKRLQAGQQET